ncbi:glutathione S-transferase N-terminal domain-containing protein [Patescibacteria group bacterium]|nr:glutathione S-transferase N-terminal domain-containing protein [Patescibacteria group bacterium]
MYILYVRENCPFSNKVRKACDDMGIELTLKDIKEPLLEEELVEKGGKVQTPYLVDTVKGTEMYEADDIISYLIGETI